MKTGTIVVTIAPDEGAPFHLKLPIEYVIEPSDFKRYADDPRQVIHKTHDRLKLTTVAGYDAREGLAHLMTTLSRWADEGVICEFDVDVGALLEERAQMRARRGA